MLSILLTKIAVLFCNFSLAAVVPRSAYALHEKRDGRAATWVQGQRVSGDSILPIRIALVQNNLDSAYEHLMNVSDPSSSNYGKHWTQAEVQRFLAPRPDAVRALRNWLVSEGLSDKHIISSDNQGWLAFDIRASKAEQLFNTEYYEHEHAKSGALTIGSEMYHAPKHLQAHIDYITPGVKFSAPLRKRVVDDSANTESHGRRPERVNISPSHRPHSSSPPPECPPDLPSSLQNCSTSATPACFKALYNIPDATRNDTCNDLGVYELGDIYAQADLNAFFAAYAPYVPKGTHPIPALIDGAIAPVVQASPWNTGESALDLELLHSLLYPQSLTLYQVDDLYYNQLETYDGGYDGFLNTFLDALDGSYCNYTAYGITGDSPGIDPTYPDPHGYTGSLQCGVYKPTRVVSISYGEAEADLPAAYQKRLCSEFMKLGLQGHTIVSASGDTGVGSSAGDVSKTGCLGTNADIFSPLSAASCPFVLSVGATQFQANQTILDPESAMEFTLKSNHLTVSSGGGFSNYFRRPSYQKAAVKHYFSHHPPSYPSYTTNFNTWVNSTSNITKGVFNRNGRGIPDVSALGANFPTILQGEKELLSGSSVATPVWAAIITMINQERTAVGKGPVGFINPVLYQNSEILRDVKNGSNPNCGTEGFKAVEGWDPVTGLGTPDFPKLLKLFLSLP